MGPFHFDQTGPATQLSSGQARYLLLHLHLWPEPHLVQKWEFITPTAAFTSVVWTKLGSEVWPCHTHCCIYICGLNQTWFRSLNLWHPLPHLHLWSEPDLVQKSELVTPTATFTSVICISLFPVSPPPPPPPSSSPSAASMWPSAWNETVLYKCDTDPDTDTGQPATRHVAHCLNCVKELMKGNLLHLQSSHRIAPHSARTL